jgi:hypothetical protein
MSGFRAARAGDEVGGRTVEVSDVESQQKPRASRTAEPAPGTAQPQPTNAPVEGGKVGSEVQEQATAPRPASPREGGRAGHTG